MALITDLEIEKTAQRLVDNITGENWDKLRKKAEEMKLPSEDASIPCTLCKCNCGTHKVCKVFSPISCLCKEFGHNYCQGPLGSIPSNYSGNENFNKLSKGMKKQIMFILALSIKPEYLIMDEPFDGLDPHIRKVIWDILIKDVSERKMTIFISSHHLNELDSMCDHIALISKGKIVFEEALDKLEAYLDKASLANLSPDSEGFSAPADFLLLR